MKNKKILLTFTLVLFILITMGSVYSVDPGQSNETTSGDNDFTQEHILNASQEVKNFAEINNKIPETVIINNQSVQMSQFLYFLSSSVLDIDQNINNSYTNKNVSAAISPSENTAGGSISKTEYLDCAQRIKNFIEENNRVPNFASTSLGTMSPETQIYLLSRILSSYQYSQTLPDSAMVIPGLKIATGTTVPTPPQIPTNETPTPPPTSDSTTKKTFTIVQISSASSTVKRYYDSYKRLPATVTINNQKITMLEFSYLLTKAVTNLNSNIISPITLKNFTSPPKPSENIKSGTLTKTAYLDLARKIKNYIESYNRAPNYISTSLGNIRYESQVLVFSRIMSFYHTNKRLPYSVTVTPGVKIENPSNPIQLPITTTIIYRTSYGHVQKIGTFGTGLDKVAIIIGVHPHEGAVHVAMVDAIRASNLKNVRVDIFQVVVYDATDRNESRIQGETLANKYVVPLINSNYKLAIDVHGNRGNYELLDFLFAPSKGNLSVSYANKLISNSNGLIRYLYIEGTSPPMVTLPIASKGIPAVVLELYWIDEQSILLQKCKTVVSALDSTFA